MKRYLSLFTLLTAFIAHAQPSPYSNAIFNPVSMTATGQTSAPIKMAQYSATGGGFSLGTITVTATALTTVTFGVLASSQNGAAGTFFPVNIWNSLTPGNQATTATATVPGQYHFSLAGVTDIEYVTSGTFTATGLTFSLTATPAPSVSANVGTSTGGTIPETDNLLIGGANNAAGDSGINPTAIPTLSANNPWTGNNSFVRLSAQQINGSGGPVTVAVNTACAGTGATATPAAGSTNISGQIDITIGIAPTVSCVLATVTFVPAWTSAPKSCGPPDPQNATSLVQAAAIYFGTPTTTGFTINSTPIAIPASTALVEGYKCQ